MSQHGPESVGAEPASHLKGGPASR